MHKRIHEFAIRNKRGDPDEQQVARSEDRGRTRPSPDPDPPCDPRHQPFANIGIVYQRLHTRMLKTKSSIHLEGVTP